MALRTRSPDETPGDGCCSPALATPLARDDAERRARLLKAIADPTRLQLLALIRGSEGGRACVCDLTEPLGLTQPTVSYHLKVLTDEGLLKRQRRGIWAWYAIDQERLDECGLGTFLDRALRPDASPATERPPGLGMNVNKARKPR
jgi:ArsR family transcriptional regulator, arsenate/arsenite/antimonite-responsive transcriptional repressor